MFEAFFDVIFDLFYLGSGKGGPLRVHAEWDGGVLVLKLKNEGKRKLKFAAVVGYDQDNKKVFPNADLAIGALFEPKQTYEIKINKNELLDLDCRRLVVMDTRGNQWDVEGFSLEMLNQVHEQE